jgi:glycosyltransferase involved in cell wall biosynthesis
LAIIGDGTYLPALKQLVVDLGLTQQVSFHGKVTHEQVLELLQNAHLFCYPTKASEGFPKVILEALAAGLPVVTTRVSVLPQLLSSGSGVLLDEATAGAVTQAVERIITNPKAYETMSQKAVDTAGAYSLENWQATIGQALAASWGPLRADA